MRRPSRGRRLLLFVVMAGVVVAASLGTTALLTGLDKGVTAAGGFEYRTDTYSVLLPGEPETSSQRLPGTDVVVETANWSNKQKVYAVASAQTPEGGSLEDALNGTLAQSGATLVAREDVTIDGGSGILAQSTVDGETVWTLFVLDEHGGFYTLSHSGDVKDEAFFDSFRLL